MKNKILVFTMSCLIFILAISSFLILGQRATISEKDFPLEVDLGKKDFSLGEKISLDVTITNRSGKDVNISSNGEMPCVFFHNINDTTTHGETTERVDQILKANDRISRVFMYEASETGTYILDVHYRIDVNDKINDIVIEVK